MLLITLNRKNLAKTLADVRLPPLKVNLDCLEDAEGLQATGLPRGARRPPALLSLPHPKLGCLWRLVE